jgi:chromosome partitioning protein
MEEADMHIIAIVNQKGGCGKTTTAINLSAALGQQGARVLLIDMDPQGHASLGLGVAGAELASFYELLKGEYRLDQVIQSGVTKGVDLIPGNISLAAAEHLLAGQPDKDLATLEENYDCVVLDCPPALGLLSVNALRAADQIVIPVEPSLYSLDGIERLRETIHVLAGQYDIQPTISVLANMFDIRTRIARNMLDMLESQLPIDLCATRIRNSVCVREAACHGIPLTDHSPRAPVTGDYRELAEELFGSVLQRVCSEMKHALAKQADNPPADRTVAETSDLKEVVFHFDKSKRVQIAGEFNNWIPDKNVETEILDGSLQKILRVSPGGYEYRFIIDGVWQQDPANPEAIPNDMGGYNSLIKV